MRSLRYVCLFVCLSQRQILPIFVSVAYARGSIDPVAALRTSCTSGFVDDLMFSRNCPVARVM